MNHGNAILNQNVKGSITIIRQNLILSSACLVFWTSRTHDPWTHGTPLLMLHSEKSPNEPPSGGNERKTRLKTLIFRISLWTDGGQETAARPHTTQEILSPWEGVRLPTPMNDR
jgi:hypothetical protein